MRAPAVALLTCSCSFSGAALLPDFDGIGDCGNLSLEELATADEISQACRAEIEALLPQSQTTFVGTLVPLGQTAAVDGTRRFYVHGASATGMALRSATLQQGLVTVVQDGATTEVPPQEVMIRSLGGEAAELMSLAIVNDYSASMLDQDLDAVAGIHTNVLYFMPPIYEAEVTYFSEEVVVQVPWTLDQGAILDGVQRSAALSRSSTALHDGMGLALEGLVARARPLKVMMVSTDGAENASVRVNKGDLVAGIAAEGVVVVMLGALLADVDEMHELAGDHGLAFYTRDYGELNALMQEYLESLSSIVEVTLPAAYAEADSVTLTAAGVSVEFDR